MYTVRRQGLYAPEILQQQEGTVHLWQGNGATCRVASAEGPLEEHAASLLLRHESVCAHISVPVVAAPILDGPRADLQRQQQGWVHGSPLALSPLSPSSTTISLSTAYAIVT